MRLFLAALFLSLLAIYAVTPSRAQACSIRPCSTPFLGDDGEAETVRIPPNLKAVQLGPFFSRSDNVFKGLGLSLVDPFDPTGPKEDRGEFEAPRIVERKSGARVPYELRRLDGAGSESNWELVFDAPLKPSTNYHVRGVRKKTCLSMRGNDPSELEEVRSFQLRTLAKPLPNPPKRLGELKVSEPEFGMLTIAAGGSCSMRVDAHYVDISVDEAQVGPWKPYLYYRTEYAFADAGDGELGEVRFKKWGASSRIGETIAFGTSWQGKGVDRIYRRCNPVQKESKKPWLLIRMVGAIPGTQDVIYSGISAVEMPCPGIKPEEEEEEPELAADVPEPEPEPLVEVDESGDDILSEPASAARPRFDWSQVEQAQAQEQEKKVGSGLSLKYGAIFLIAVALGLVVVALRGR